MATGIFYIILDTLWIIISILNKSSLEKRGKSSYGWGFLAGANAVMILLWISKLAGWATFAS
jgi:hypothetical protein